MSFKLLTDEFLHVCPLFIKLSLKTGCQLLLHQTYFLLVCLYGCFQLSNPVLEFRQGDWILVFVLDTCFIRRGKSLTCTSRIREVGLIQIFSSSEGQAVTFCIHSEEISYKPEILIGLTQDALS